MKFLFWSVLTVVFCLLPICFVHSAEDVGRIIAQADEAVTRGDCEQGLEIAKTILEVAPQNLDGYRLALTCCVKTGRERGFSLLVEEAKKQGVPELEVDRLAAVILYAAGQSSSAYEKMYEYEMKWREIHDKSR